MTTPAPESERANTDVSAPTVPEVSGLSVEPHEHSHGDGNSTGYYSVQIEVWRRAYFKKGRPKSETVVFKATDNAELLRFVKIHGDAFYGNRRWQVKSVREITREEVVAPEATENSRSKHETR